MFLELSFIYKAYSTLFHAFSAFVNVFLKQTAETPQIGEIFETETKPELVGDDGDSSDHAKKSQKVASLYQLADNVVHCHVQQQLHQEWLNEFCETVSISLQLELLVLFKKIFQQGLLYLFVQFYA